MGCFSSKPKSAADQVPDPKLTIGTQQSNDAYPKGQRRRSSNQRQRSSRFTRSVTSTGGGLILPKLHHSSPTAESVSSMYFDAEDELEPDSPHGEDHTEAVLAWQTSLFRHSKPHSRKNTEEWVEMERQIMSKDAFLEPAMPSNSCLPIFSDVYSQRYVCLTKPPAGMSMLPASTQASIRQQMRAEDGAAAGGGEQEASSSQEGAEQSRASPTNPAARKLASSAEVGPSGRLPVCESCEEADSTTFPVRGLKYATNKMKEKSSSAFYKLVTSDIYAFDIKLNHIAKHVQLPVAPVLGDMSHLPPEERLPPLLIVNIQLPLYQASLFGATDGDGASLVYYFALPEGWTPEQESNKAALGLLQRFVHDGREADKTPTRDRLKLLARIANVEEWAERGPLSGYELALLRKYNDKPLMTRPQQKFFTGPNYLEIDLDVHQWAYLARKAFTGFITRLTSVIFENALIIQGNTEDELPEQILGCARVRYIQVDRLKSFPADTIEHALAEGSPLANGAQSLSV